MNQPMPSADATPFALLNVVLNTFGARLGEYFAAVLAPAGVLLVALPIAGFFSIIGIYAAIVVFVFVQFACLLIVLEVPESLVVLAFVVGHLAAAAAAVGTMVGSLLPVVLPVWLVLTPMVGSLTRALARCIDDPSSRLLPSATVDTMEQTVIPMMGLSMLSVVASALGVCTVGVFAALWSLGSMLALPLVALDGQGAFRAVAASVRFSLRRPAVAGQLFLAVLVIQILIGWVPLFGPLLAVPAVIELLVRVYRVHRDELLALA